MGKGSHSGGLRSERESGSGDSPRNKHTSKSVAVALAGVAQWIECQTANQKVTGLIPSQGTCLGCGPGTQYSPCERQRYIDVSLSLSLFPFPLSVKIYKVFLRKSVAVKGRGLRWCLGVRRRFIF